MARGKVIPDLYWTDKSTKLWYGIAYQDESLRPRTKAAGFKYVATNGVMLVATWSPQMGVFVSDKGLVCCYVCGVIDSQDECRTQIGPEWNTFRLAALENEIRFAFEEASGNEWEEFVTRF